MAQQPGTGTTTSNEDEAFEILDAEANAGETGDDDSQAPNIVTLTPDDDIEVILPGADEAADPEPDPLEADPAEAAAELDDEDRSYSARVQARIKREKKVTAAARDELEQERQGRKTAEQRALEATQHATDAMLENLDYKIQQKRSEFKKAKEDGLTDEEITAQSELADLEAKKRDLGQVKTNITSAQERLKTEGQKPAVTPVAQAWLGRNKWFRHPQFYAETAAAQTIDRAMVASGMDPASPEYFRALDQEIKTKMPDIGAKIGNLLRAGEGTRTPGSSVAPVSRAASAQIVRSAQGKRVVTLTQADLANMERFKLDRNNPEHVKQYAREKN